jgi:hypothetical protein
VSADDPTSWRFSVPTLCNQLPEVALGHGSQDDLTVDEDLWRAVELMDRSISTEDDRRAIQGILDEANGKVGFERCHLRTDVEDAVRGHLQRADLMRAFGLEEDVVKGLEIRGQGLVVQGFSAQVDEGAFVYGVTDSSRARCLVVCFCDVRGVGVVPQRVELAELVKVKKLKVVDWFHGQQLAPK